MPSRYNLRQKFIDLISRSDRREFEEIRQIAQDFCDGNITQYEFKAKYGESKASKKKLPSLAAHDLTAQQVGQILQIKPASGDDELANVQSCPIPTELRSVFEKVNGARSNSPMNEANIPIQTERHWVLPIRFEKQDMNLVGKPDYAVWYGNANDTAVNVVVVEAKGMGNAGQGMIQCLAYMGEYFLL
ncbi:hypothetical protein PENCOP_c002G02772 [Penicillium coprophilum]|uniref:Uncharacterized protein n=1 Tax=Penicillium coprophilum TaxID=36646 RepID=A0A1V6V1R6_9EURO|nr:hypothetical protein PENCOP_c002G02772 [Penicillium coprophilum]